MSLIPLDASHVNEAIISDAQYVRSFMQWLRQKNASYAALLTDNVLTNAGIDSGDIPYVNAFIAGMGRLEKAGNGQAVAAVDPITGHIIHILGLT